MKFGVIGCGAMGKAHAESILKGEVPGAELAAVADIDPMRLAPFPEDMRFASGAALLDSGRCQAVIIATPHPSHVELGLAALRAGLHVLIEKPLAVSVSDARRLLTCPRRPEQLLGVVFHQRAFSVHRELKRLVQEGKLGRLQRFACTCTDWFRTDAYYASESWRATWEGEGGGLLMNQAPHNLDLLYWLCGQPSRVQAFCGFGKYHAIQTEDEVTAFLEYPGGLSGVFTASTGEAPGVNRLELVGDRATVLLEGDRLVLRINQEPASEFLRSALEPMAKPVWKEQIIDCTPRPAKGGQTAALCNLIQAAAGQEPLLCPAEEAVGQVELSNAMLLSAWIGRAVELPLDGEAFDRELQRRIESSARVGSRSRP